MAVDLSNLTEEQFVRAQQALDVAAINGIVDLAIVLRKRGLMTAEEAEHMHAAMSKPFMMPQNANNPLVQDAQQVLDSLFAAILERRN
jgi:hypothetical protein